MPLTDIAIKAVKPTAKPMKLFDTGRIIPHCCPKRRQVVAFQIPLPGKAQDAVPGHLPHCVSQGRQGEARRVKAPACPRR
jgi:hypothetical protein